MSSTEKEGTPPNTAAHLRISRLIHVQCERPNPLQKCLRCAKYNHECDESRVSNRAQRGRSQHSRQSAARRERTIDRPHTAQYNLPADLLQSSSDSGASSVYIKQSVSPRSSRSTSSDLSSSLATPHSQECLPLQYFSDMIPFRERQDSLQSFTCSPGAQWFEHSEAAFEQDFALGWDTFWPNGDEVAFTMTETSQWMGHPDLEHGLGFEALAQASGDANRLLDVAFPPLPGLTNIRPSRNRRPSPVEARLENRVVRLWDSYEVFATVTSGRLAVTPLFGRTFSELFRLSKTMAEGGVRIVEPSSLKHLLTFSL